MPHKLHSVELNNQNQANYISLQKWVESQINSRVLNTQPKDTILPKTIQWDSSWELMEYLVVGGVVTKIWKSWTITIGEINYNWLSRFDIEIICRTTGGSVFSVSNGAYFTKSFWWNIQDIVGKETSNMKNVSLVAFIYSALNNQPIFETKLLVRYINQSNHD